VRSIGTGPGFLQTASKSYSPREVSKVIHALCTRCRWEAIRGNTVSDKILFVDDEPDVLNGYKRILHREFQVDTAVGGEKALAAIQEHGPYAVVISDMRMPEMNGAQFLARVRGTAPDTVRMLLTGYTDLDAAMQAVNEGNISSKRPSWGA
jgi:CheY-like chemotaxis protein